MGANIDTVTFENVKKEKLRKLWSKAIEQAKYDHGHEGYTGTIAEKDGLQIVNRVFNTADEAYDYIEENSGKWDEALACEYRSNTKMTDTSKKKREKLVKVVEKTDKACDELRYKFQDEFDKGKSEFRGCKHCGSKLSKKFINNPVCPLCRSSLFSPTQIKRLDVLKKKKEKAQKEFNDFKPKYAGGKKTSWVCGGWCSS